jgi:hypothetical protein
LGLSRGGAAAANLPGCISTWSLSRQPSTSSPRAARSIFYARLFAAAPSVKPLFDGTDLRRQKAMLLGALVLVRKSLRDMDAMLPTLRELIWRVVRQPERLVLARGRCGGRSVVGWVGGGPAGVVRDARSG